MSAARLPCSAKASSIVKALMAPPECGGPRSPTYGRRGAGSRGQDLGEVLVAAARQADEVEVAFGLLQHPRDRVRGLERRNDPVAGRELAERRDRLLVGHRDVARAAGVAQPCVLGAA